MDVLKITPRGYCHGVVEAIRAAKQTAKAHPGEKIRMLGYLVHNTHVTDELQESGIELVDSDNRLEGLNKIDGGTVIFTAHGVSPAVKDKAAARGLNLVDATCSDVVVTHDLVKDLAERGYDVVYIGRRGHPEPEGAGKSPPRAGPGGR
jgi:4-hydroxy-3-methylbut-2-enyl diphosphate reductase